MAPSCNQRHNALPLGTPPGRCVGLAEPDRGCSNAKGKSYFAGSSQARALTCTTSSGGKVGGRPGRSRSSNPARRSVRKRLRQSETTFTAGVEAVGNLVVGPCRGRRKGSFWHVG